MVASQFTCFPQLPLEVRRTIWKACKPSTRVMEFNIPNRDGLGGQSICRLDATSNRNGRPPAFSRVCREAREVACEEGCFMWNAAELSGLRGIAEKDNFNPWFFPHSDIIHLNSPDPFISEGANIHSKLSAFLALKPKAISISFALELFFKSWPGETGKSVRLFNSLETQQEYLMVVKTITIHATDEQAIASGLFECLEAPVQLVDPDICLPDYLVKAKETIENVWLMFKYREACEDKSLHTAGTVNNIRLHQPPYMHFNRTHHWVKGTLTNMPRIRPMVMFRHCSDKCLTEGTK